MWLLFLCIQIPTSLVLTFQIEPVFAITYLLGLQTSIFTFIIQHEFSLNYSKSVYLPPDVCIRTFWNRDTSSSRISLYTKRSSMLITNGLKILSCVARPHSIYSSVFLVELYRISNSTHFSHCKRTFQTLLDWLTKNSLVFAIQRFICSFLVKKKSIAVLLNSFSYWKWTSQTHDISQSIEWTVPFFCCTYGILPC